MYGIYGGFTTIFHTVVRFPAVAVVAGCVGLACLPTPETPSAPPVIEDVVVKAPTLKISVYFDLDKSKIKPTFQNLLEKEAKYLKDNPKAVVIVEGNTDERAGVEYNKALGDRRARAVRKALIKLGVAENRIKTISYGKSKLKLLCKKKSCHQENRRVDVSDIEQKP